MIEANSTRKTGLYNPGQDILLKLKDLSSRARFISFTYRAKYNGELARHTLIFGVSYKKQIEKSLEALEMLLPTLTHSLEIQAYEELRMSFEDSLRALEESQRTGKQVFNSDYTKPHVYVPIAEGLKFYVDGGTVNASGLEHQKVVIEPGRDIQVRSSPLVIVKNGLRAQLPVNRWREFVISPETLISARLQGETIEMS